jgi:DNA repair exonuclease SbcCD ATPase subunit
MITKIQIRNFRTHKKLDVQFSKRVTSIVGPSYAGKSTVIRALRWVVMNKPTGTSIIQWGSTKVTTRLWVDESVIKRTRSNNINSYWLDGKRFVAFGNDVPTPITSKLNLSNINFQGQHDAPFWFCETAGEVSRQLNTIVNLDAIDKALAYISSEQRKTDNEIGFIQKRLDELKIKKEQLSFASKMDEDLKICENALKEYEKQCLKLGTLGESIERAGNYRDISIRQNAVAVAINSIVVLGKSTLDLDNQTTKMGGLIDEIKKEQEILDNIPPSIEPLNRIFQKWKENQKQSEILNVLICDIQNKILQILTIQKSVQKIQNEMKTISKGRCPLCGHIKKGEKSDE